MYITERKDFKKTFFVLNVIFGCLSVFSTPVEARKVAVVLGRQIVPYQAALAGIKQRNKFEMVHYSMDGDAVQGQKIMQSLTPGNTDLVITIGIEALKSAENYLGNLPVVYTMIYEQPANTNTNVSGVIIKIKTADQFSYLRKLFPLAKTVGVIYSPESSGTVINQAREIAVKYGFSLVPIAIEESSQLDQALTKLRAAKLDVLWSVLDQVVSRPEVVKKIIEQSLADKTPFVGLSELHVKAGALAAFAVDYSDVGSQAAALAEAVLEKNSSLRVEEPRLIIIYMNRKTQRALELSEFPQNLNVKYVE